MIAGLLACLFVGDSTAQVEAVATSCGDYVLDLAELPTRDRIHPATYAGIATALRRLGVQ